MDISWGVGGLSRCVRASRGHKAEKRVSQVGSYWGIGEGSCELVFLTVDSLLFFSGPFLSFYLFMSVISVVITVVVCFIFSRSNHHQLCSIFYISKSIIFISILWILFIFIFCFRFFNIYLSIISLIKEAIISHVVDLFSRYRSYYSFRIIVRRTYVFQKAIRYYFSQSLSYYITMDTTDHLTLYVGLSLSRLRHSLPFLPSRRTEDLRKWWLRRGFGAKKWWCGFVLSFRLFLVFRKGRDFFFFLLGCVGCVGRVTL